MSAQSAPFCRDCLSEVSHRDGDRCSACGSPRLLSAPGARPALDRPCRLRRVLRHGRKTRRPEPRRQAGDRRRGTARGRLHRCYIARTYGVRSAMPMFKALKACPHAVVIRPGYGQVPDRRQGGRAGSWPSSPHWSSRVSIDEAFLDLSGTERLHHASPAVTLARFARRVEDEIGITVSIGLSANKFLAKIASDLEKPRGFSIIGRRKPRRSWPTSRSRSCRESVPPLRRASRKRE